MFEEDLPTQHLASLDLQSDYRVQFTMEGNTTTILIEPANEMIKNFRSFKLSCPSADVSMRERERERERAVRVCMKVNCYLLRSGVYDLSHAQCAC